MIFFSLCFQERNREENDRNGRMFRRERRRRRRRRKVMFLDLCVDSSPSSSSLSHPPLSERVSLFFGLRAHREE